MAVLTLRGKPINWAKPPKPTTKVMWSKRTVYGRAVIGSLRTIAHLDHLDTLSVKKFGTGISVYQSPYNTSVAASAGTHDYDACLDVWIPGVDGFTQQAFFRANGAGAYYRRPEQGFSTHIHYLCLPPREGQNVSDDYRSAGFKVGQYVDGGWSLYGRAVASSQIEDYYSGRTALSGHAVDPSWFPPNRAATVFDLKAYIDRQYKATARGTLRVLTANIASRARVPELVPVIRNQKPDIVVISEAYYAREFLRGIDGYRNVQGSRKKFGSEGPDVAVLVRKGVKISRRRTLKMAEKWVGPKGGGHDGRVYPAFNARVDGFWWRVLALHFPWEGKRGPAQRESESAVAKWFKSKAKPQGRPAVASGDINQTVERIEDWCPAYVAPGTKVDHAMYNNCEHVKTVRLAKTQPEGMHGWVLYVFRTNQKKGK